MIKIFNLFKGGFIMAATEISRNAETRFCHFAIDSDDDLQKLPTSTSFGKNELKTCTTCCQGSIARASDGRIYILNGSNTWVIVNNNGANNGSSQDDVDENAVIDSLFNINTERNTIDTMFGN